MAVVGGIISIAGALFLFLAALGIIRMPDTYSRMQAGTKATTLGTILFAVGIGIARPEWIPKIFLLIAFILITNPVSSHALARAAKNSGVSLGERAVEDDLSESVDTQTEGSADSHTSETTENKEGGK